MFHDVFGHMPLLSNKQYANFFSDFGKKDMLYNVIKTKLRSLKILKLINNEADDREELFDLIEGTTVAAQAGKSSVPERQEPPKNS